MRIAPWLLALPLCLSAASDDDLVLSQFPLPIRTLVYELPGLPPEGVSQIAARLRNALPHAELIDGASAADSVLREKLRGPWMLITLLSEESRLLKMTAAPLPLRLENGAFRWGAFTAPAREVRVRFMGKNPFGGGSCMVDALGPGQGMGLSNSGWNSYVIYRGAELAARGVYDRQFIERGPVSLAEGNADVEEFFTTLERVHPDVSARLGEDGYARLRATTRKGVAALADGQGRVREERLAWLLFYAAAALRDGHTSVTWRVEPRQQDMTGKRFPPFLLDTEDGRFRITAARDEALSGTELLAVNGVPVAEFFRPVLDRCSGETATFRARLLARDQAFWWWLSNLFGSAGASVPLRVRDAGGAVREHTAGTLDFSEYARLRAPARPSRAAGLHSFDGGKIAHWVYPAFSSGDAEKAAIDELIRRICDSGAADLIIDLRGNGGGVSTTGDYIFRRIWREPVEQASETRVKLSPEAIVEMRKHLPWMPRAAEKLFEANRGKVVSSRDPAARGLYAEAEKLRPPEPKPAAVYSGRLWLMVDNGVFSSANIFTSAFRDYAMGTTVGYETGQPPVHFGNFQGFRLKHSRIPYRVSTQQFFPVKPRPGDEEHGIVPDVRLNTAALAPYRQESDPELAFTLDLVRRRK